MTNQHPNATAATVAGGAGALVIWLLGHFHLNLSAEDGAAIATVIAGAVLFIGRNGIKGAADKLWKGSPAPPARKPTTRTRRKPS